LAPLEPFASVLFGFRGTMQPHYYIKMGETLTCSPINPILQLREGIITLAFLWGEKL